MQLGGVYYYGCGWLLLYLARRLRRLVMICCLGLEGAEASVRQVTLPSFLHLPILEEAEQVVLQSGLYLPLSNL